MAHVTLNLFMDHRGNPLIPLIKVQTFFGPSFRFHQQFRPSRFILTAVFGPAGQIHGACRAEVDTAHAEAAGAPCPRIPFFHGEPLRWTIPHTETALIAPLLPGIIPVQDAVEQLVVEQIAEDEEREGKKNKWQPGNSGTGEFLTRFHRTVDIFS